MPMINLNRGKRLCVALLLFSLSVFSVAADKPTLDDANAFMEDVEKELRRLNIEGSRAAWINANFITPDTQTLSAKATERVIVAAVGFAKASTRFDGLKMPADLARKFAILKLSTSMPTPEDAKLAEEITQIVTGMQGTYGAGKYCPDGEDGECFTLGQLSKTMATVRDAEKLKQAWLGWRTVSPPMKKSYARFVELGNQGARELGYKNLGEMWCSNYDMPPEEFPKELDRLWDQVKPLYLRLHAYVRMRLRQHYGDATVPQKGPIPAHLLGNMWSQSWGNIYPLVAPKDGDPGYDLTEILQSRNIDAIQMVRYGEGFFTSLGLDPLPKSFWETSLFTKPKDREVVCHASAWSIDFEDDLRIKMCIEITDEDFVTIHHELGHNYYQRAYNRQPLMFQNSANDGFHEAVGDTLALSITPDYLVKLGFLEKGPDASKDVGLLLKMALDKIAFLPFGLLIDQWRWKVFSGEITPADYNKAWWELRQKYQGISAPVARSEKDFDPGAKYHVPANVPYTRYFLAHILQFQFHRALVKEAGRNGPLNRASIYGSKKAGAKLNAMLSMGASKPWPEALHALTGEKQMDASAILDYFKPLQDWLDKELEGQPIGW